MKRVGLLMFCCLFAAFALAQAPTQPAGDPAPTPATASAPAIPAADAASKQDVMNLLSALKVKENMANMLEGMRDQMKKGARQGIAARRLTATDAQVSQMDGMIDDMFKQVPLDEMLDAMVPVYQKHLSKPEMAAISSFYMSPAGQKLLSEQPAMMQEGFQAGGSLMESRMEPMMKQLDERMQKLEAEMTPAAQPAAAPAPAKSKSTPAKAGATKPSASRAGTAKPAAAKPAATPKP